MFDYWVMEGGLVFCVRWWVCCLVYVIIYLKHLRRSTEMGRVVVGGSKAEFIY